MEEVRPVVIEKYVFEYRDTSKFLSFFGFFGLSRIRRNVQDPLFFYLTVLFM